MRKTIKILEHKNKIIRYSEKTGRVYLKRKWKNNSRFSWRLVDQEEILGSIGVKVSDDAFFFPSNFDRSKMRTVSVIANWEHRMQYEYNLRDKERIAAERLKQDKILEDKRDALMRGEFSDTAMRLIGIGKDEEFLKKCKPIKEEVSVFAKRAGYSCKWCGISCDESRDCQTTACKATRFRRRTVAAVEGKILPSEKYKVMW